MFPQSRCIRFLSLVRSTPRTNFNYLGNRADFVSDKVKRIRLRRSFYLFTTDQNRLVHPRPAYAKGMAGPSACADCNEASQKIVDLTDERNTIEAQRDHYSARCNELTAELGLAKQQLKEKFKISDCSPTDSSLFESESLERLREWQKCLAFCIEERMEKEDFVTRPSVVEDGERQEEGGLRIQKRGQSQPGEGVQTVLPLSPGNLTGFLTKNHRLTQKYTEYPEPKHGNPQPRKSLEESTSSNERDIA